MDTAAPEPTPANRIINIAVAMVGNAYLLVDALMAAVEPGPEVRPFDGVHTLSGLMKVMTETMPLLLAADDDYRAVLIVHQRSTGSLTVRGIGPQRTVPQILDFLKETQTALEAEAARKTANNPEKPS